MPSITRVEWVADGKLTQAAKTQAEKLIAALFPDHLVGGRYRFGQKGADPHRLLLWTDETLAGHLLSVRRDARLNGDTLKILFVGEIGVLPEFQGKGFGRQLLTGLEPHIPPDIDLGLLCCTKDKQGFYEKCGWELLDLKLYLGPDETRSRCVEGIVMAKVRSALAHRALEEKNASLFLGEPV